MKIKIKTEVKGNYKNIAAGFDLQLFEYLVPPFTKVKIKEFTGSKKGDRVHVQFIFPMKTEWISAITADGSDEHEVFFVDEGVKLPPGLGYWKHRHVIQKSGPHTSLIIDDIEFKGSNRILDYLLYLPLWITFSMRIPMYKRYFKKFSKNG